MSILAHNDVILNILLNLEDRELLSACLTNKKVNAVCNSDLFWKKRFSNKYGQKLLNETEEFLNNQKDRNNKEIINYKNLYLRTLMLLHSSFIPSPSDYLWGGNVKNTLKYYHSSDKYVPLDLDDIIMIKLKKLDLRKITQLAEIKKYFYQGEYAYSAMDKLYPVKLPPLITLEEVYKLIERTSGVDFSKYFISGRHIDNYDPVIKYEFVPVEDIEEY